MGRWTAEYQDDVFLSKLKGLVSGAIKRTKLEKAEPTISYKHFVEDLDAGDSFTTAVIEILVQELAERRLRSSPGDRRLIADRTAKSLRLLATPIRIYRERRTAARRTVNMAEYLTAPPDELDMEEDDDEFETMLDRATMPVEGVRINSELFDAYYPPSWTTAAATTRRSLPAAGPPTPALSDDSQSQTPPGLSPPSTTRAPAVSVWALPPAAPASLSLARQPPLRRTSAARARAVDFNDFTAHRRASTRTAASAPAPAAAAAEPGAGAGDEPWMRAGASARATRRFFPFSYQTRTARHGGARTDELFDRGGGNSSDEALYLTETDPEPEPEHEPPASYFSFPTPASTAGAGVAGPRLRRGGVRPPESLLLRRVSPVLSVLEGGALRSPGSVSVGEDATGGPGSAAEAEAASYPTPEPGPSE
ncbi:hypothetical protein DFH08DRAFT_928810 [Mycena albidolilacea]|uniref:Uncharacterized protein n=1 Tax=Mycena albidolilacea TaxID=1033008 RepID=A0AAD7AVV2_9AGAR|nr:hypothetical protein DFH08DRAFT_928810 [Mycena albidolilacea]